MNNNECAFSVIIAVLLAFLIGGQIGLSAQRAIIFESVRNGNCQIVERQLFCNY